MSQAKSANGKKKLSDFKPQRRNANRGKQAGLRELDKSIRRDGYSAPMVAAADGEIFAGSKRLERAADVFGVDVEPIVVGHYLSTKPGGNFLRAIASAVLWQRPHSVTRLYNSFDLSGSMKHLAGIT